MPQSVLGWYRVIEWSDLDALIKLSVALLFNVLIHGCFTNLLQAAAEDLQGRVLTVVFQVLYQISQGALEQAYF